MDALIEIGHPVQEVCVQSAELEPILDGFNPNEYLIFNWCEELPGIPRSASQVAQALDRMGFTYTGTGADALAFSQDKRQVKAQSALPGYSHTTLANCYHRQFRWMGLLPGYRQAGSRALQLWGHPRGCGFISH